ncbi:MAG: adenylosuccinate synthase [Vampirovibrionales bacterium]
MSSPSAFHTTMVVGAQWGDEGKAKVTDLFAETAEVVVRCQGGCNAGHTVKHHGTVYKFHLVPSGILYPETLCVIGSGVVIHPEMLKKELDNLLQQGIQLNHLRISDRAHLTLPFHVTADQYAEACSGEKKIGTTGRGIGPTYMDKVGRYGLRMVDLFEQDDDLKDRLADILAQKQVLLAHLEGQHGVKHTVESLFAACQQWRDWFAPYVCETVSLLNDAVDAGKHVVFEGAQGTLLDIDYGTYPFVTSSNATSGGLCTGSGIGPSKIQHVYGVMKAYTTRVGEGPFPTELFDADGQHMVTVGHEFGTTTGRQRRCGWFDAVMGRFSVQVNGLTGVCLTKLDVLTGIQTLSIAVAYEDIETGERFHTFPSSLKQLARLKPVYETMAGWDTPITGKETSLEELPEAAQRYVARLQDLLKTPIVLVSIGPERSETIDCR